MSRSQRRSKKCSSGKEPLWRWLSLGWSGMTHRPDDGNSKPLWNSGQFLRDYTAWRPIVIVSARILTRSLFVSHNIQRTESSYFPFVDLRSKSVLRDKWVTCVSAFSNPVIKLRTLVLFILMYYFDKSRPATSKQKEDCTRNRNTYKNFTI
jgi:hypothetical protein